MSMWKGFAPLLSILVLCSRTAVADSVWSEVMRTAYVAGCATAVVLPAKRDYAAAAQRAGNTNPKPFPEEALRASVEPMCGCLADRFAEEGFSYATVLGDESVARPMVEEALAGGRCKPGGMLGQLLAASSVAAPSNATEVVAGRTSELEYMEAPECNIEPQEACSSKDCVEFTPYRTYRISNFQEFGGRMRHDLQVVLASHSKRAGEWFVVMEPLTPKYRSDCRAQFRILQAAPVVEDVCFTRPLSDYVTIAAKPTVLHGVDDEWCYRVEDLK